MSNQTALIFGITGQFGSYLAELLLNKGYRVIGTKRRLSTNNYWRINHLLNNSNLVLEYCDIVDFSNVFMLINKYKPNLLFNTAAQSHVGVSFEQPLYTWQVDAEGCINILESMRILKEQINYDGKLLQCSTSELFGDNYDIDENGNKYQDENTEMKATSPYAVAKLAAHKSVQLYRKAYQINCRAMIFFNMESERRGEEFVTKKITSYIGKVYKKIQQLKLLKISNVELASIITKSIGKLHLGNIDSHRDWGYSKEYAEFAIDILEKNILDEMVICTEETHSVRHFLKIAFLLVGVDNYLDYIEIDPSLFRASEVPYLCGKCSKLKSTLGRAPQMKFKELVESMVKYDCEH